MVVEKTTQATIITSKLSSLDKIALLLQSLPQKVAEKVLASFNEYERDLISQQMRALRTFESSELETLYLEFTIEVEKLIKKREISENSNKLLKKLFDSLQKSDNQTIQPENQDDSLSITLKDIHPSNLANFLQHERPQTIALILSKIIPQKAALVFMELPEDLVIDVMDRMLNMGRVQQEVLNEIENTLKSEIKNASPLIVPQDSAAHMVDIFNTFDSKNEIKFMQKLELKNLEAAKRIKERILTIEDLKYIEGSGIKKVLDSVDKNNLVVALKGGSESLKEIFFRNMPDRAAKLLKDEIAALDMVKIRNVYEAQQEIVSQAKELIKKNEISLNKSLVNKKV